MKIIYIILLILTLSVLSSAQYFEITFDDTSGNLTPPGTMVLAGWLKNVTNDSLHIKMIRVANNLPSPSWSSSMCMNVCFPPNVDSATTMDPGFDPIPAGDSVLIDVVITQYDTIPGTAKVRIKYATLDDSQQHFQWFEASSGVSGIHPVKGQHAQRFILYNNYPNPFNNQTIITVQISSASQVRLQIYDILGREIYVADKNIPAPGLAKFKWNGVNQNGEELSSGVYFYRVSTKAAGTNIQSQIKKLTLLR